MVRAGAVRSGAQNELGLWGPVGLLTSHQNWSLVFWDELGSRRQTYLRGINTSSPSSYPSSIQEILHRFRQPEDPFPIQRPQEKV